MPLRPGQRVPTPGERHAAIEQRLRESSSRFPHGLAWEITDERAALWLAHRFRGLRAGRPQTILGAMIGDELGLLITDLELYAGLRRAGTPLPPLAEYLREGREEWGWMGRAWRALTAAGRGDPDAEADLEALLLRYGAPGAADGSDAA